MTGTLLVLGASGDLASRLLLPGLGQVIATAAVYGAIDLAQDRAGPARWACRTSEDRLVT